MRRGSPRLPSLRSSCDRLASKSARTLCGMSRRPLRSRRRAGCSSRLAFTAMSRTGVNLYDRSASNVRGSLGLMLVFAGLAFAVGWAVGVYLQAGWGPSVVMLVVALVMVWGSYFASDGIALGMARAREAQENDFTQLHNVVEGISLAAGIPKPGIYVIEDPAPNAFATGRNPKRGAVAVTTGLLEKMNRDELEGVIAHELSHIKNRDTLVMTISVTLIGLVVLVGDLMLRAVWLGGGRRRRGSGSAADGVGAGLARRRRRHGVGAGLARRRTASARVWLGGGRRRRGSGSAADSGRGLADTGADLRAAVALRNLAAAGVSGRLRCRAIDPSSQRTHLRAPQARGRPNGRSHGQPGRGAPVDRVAHRQRRRPANRKSRRLAKPPLSHPSSHRRPHQGAWRGGVRPLRQISGRQLQIAFPQSTNLMSSMS